MTTGAGSATLDSPEPLAARIRVLGSGRSDKNDPHDALSVAIAANHRTRVVCRLHNVLMELAPGGIANELNASDAVALQERVAPTTPAEAARRDQAVELLADVQRLDEQLKASHRRTRAAVAASETTLIELFGVGPIIACYLIGFTGDIARFARLRRTTAPPRSSDPPVAGSLHRVSQRGNRRLNHALHLAAICQIRQPRSEGRLSFERKVAGGKTEKEAIRSLKRHISNAVYRQLVTDAAHANEDSLGAQPPRPGRPALRALPASGDTARSGTPACRPRLRADRGIPSCYMRRWSLSHLPELLD